MKKNFFLCMSILMISSCEQRSSVPIPENGTASYVISLDEAIDDKEFSFEKYNGSFQYIQLETISESLLTDIRFLGIVHDTIVIRDDADQIMSFSNDGKFIERIGKEGGGPLEYNGIKSFSLDRNSGHVIVVDFGLRVLRYDLKGNLISSCNLKNEIARPRPDNSLFSNNYIFNFYRASNSNPYAHSFYTINDSLMSGYINPNPMYKCNSSIWSVYPLTQLDDTIVFVKPLSDTIFQFREGNVAPRFVFQHKEPSLPQSKIDFFNNVENDLNYKIYLTEQQQNGYFVGIENVFETRDFLLFSLNIGKSYLFDKSKQLLYKITGFRDVESNYVFSFKRNTDYNSLISIITPSNAITMQESMLQIKRTKEEEERFKNSPTEYEKLILDFEEENNPIVIIATFGE